VVEPDGGALGRVVRDASPEVLDVLAEHLPGADLTTLLLEVARRRAAKAKVAPADVLRARERDRFVAPGPIPWRELRAAEEVVLAALPEAFETIVLAPLVPLGTHSAVAPVDQNKVVTTVRATEVAADPTNALALEAALRRRALLRAHARSAAEVRLAACQRVTRAQRVDGPVHFSHFQVFGLVTAGRDTGHLAFERAAAAEHVRCCVDAVVGGRARAALVEVTDRRGGACAPVSDAVRAAVAGLDGVEVRDAPQRETALGYYPQWCFRVVATFGEVAFEVCDGGFVDWTQQLVGSAKERLLVSGLGVERLALGMRAA
jgi:hypothetical protein